VTSEDRVTRVEGTGCVLRGDNIDTDRIIPARFLRCVTFDGLGEHAFEDDRLQAKGDHPLDQERYAGASILLVGHNFGCGSSREHAPQALMRRGFRAFVGGSFAEIFAGNCLALGLVCATLPDEERARLMDAVELDPAQPLVVDIEARRLTSRLGSQTLHIPDGARDQLLGGTWNATSVLLAAGDAIEATARSLPYAGDFAIRP
jgi:3-isopropylmalate/(R)-2-methylmalate dehydratase small subunit